MSVVVVLGALHHDVVVDAPRLPRIDETLTGSAVDYRFGGKGGNQAVAAARMGAHVRMIGRVGRDGAGDVLLAALDRAGVDRSAVLPCDVPSGMSVAITDALGDYGAVIVSGANLENDGAVDLPDGPAVLVIQNEVPEAVNRAFVGAAREGDRVIWNAAPARGPLDAGIAARTDVLIVNRVEAADLSGQADPEAAARALRERVRGAVVVTLGAEGAVVADGTGLRRFPALTVTPVSTHGAGDAFGGALAARLCAGDALDEAVRFAIAAAGLFVAARIGVRGDVTPNAVRRAMAGPAASG